MTPAAPRSLPRRLARGLVAALVALLLGSVLAVVEPRPAPASAAVTMQLTALESRHLDRLNDWRAARGLSRLKIDAVTQLDAREWTIHMAATNRLAHDPHAGAACQAASSSCSRWAENVGYSTAGESRVFTSFEQSSGHRANMADPHVDRVGIGVFVDAHGRTWVTQRLVKCGCTNDATASSANAQRNRYRAYVRALYVDFLDRQASWSDVEATADSLVYRLDVVGGLAGSDQWLGALIDRYYVSTLGRPSDQRGKQYWINVYRSGTSPAEIAAMFYASDEFFQRSGGTNRAWVGALYREILGRGADKAGLDFWAGEADRGVSRSDIAGGFYQAVESRQVRVTDLFRHLLGRNPDQGGLDYWTGVLLDGRDVRLAATLAVSAEYQHRADQRF